MYTSLATKNARMVTKQGGQQTVMKNMTQPRLNPKYIKTERRKQIIKTDTNDRFDGKVISRSSSEDDSDFE